jgi:DNA helicase HerA-like ATPase
MPESTLTLAKNDELELALLLSRANRHGCVTGATGTGKTVTLERLAEMFSRNGVPVFLADVKGDLSGIAAAGAPNPKLTQRLTQLGLPEPEWESCPAMLWDIWGESGHPLRATPADMGPLLLSRALNLNDTQSGVLSIAFKLADEQGWEALDLKDVRALVQYVGEHAAELKTSHGNVTSASVGAIMRSLLQLEEQGADALFGEPMLDITDLTRVDRRGHGYVNILRAERLLQSPRLYATCVLWLLSELFEALPEVGDVDKPKLVFFFDEAHLLFDSAPPVLLEKIEQVVRLIRSKGVGLYFVTQSPLDVPDAVLGQLGNRVQHALRAFTKRDQKAVNAVADTMRPNPQIDMERAIQELAVGEALISLLDDQGVPGVTQRAFVLPPATRLGPLTADERSALIARSPLAGRYDKRIDRASAYEAISGETASDEDDDDKPARKQRGAAPKAEPSSGDMIKDVLFGSTGPRGGKREGLVETFAKSAARSMGSSLVREISRGLLGSLLGGGASTKRRRR